MGGWIRRRRGARSSAWLWHGTRHGNSSSKLTSALAAVLPPWHDSMQSGLHSHAATLLCTSCCRAATCGELQLFGRAANNGGLPLLQSGHVWQAPAFRQSGHEWQAPFAAERPRMAGSSLSAEHPRMTGPRFCRAAECGRLHLCRAAPHFDRRAGRSAWTGQCPSSSWYPCPPCLCLCLYRLLFLFLCLACPCHCHCWSLLHQWHGQSKRLHRQSQSPRRRGSSKS